MAVQEAIHLGSLLDEATLDSLADFICGDDTDRFPVYRSSSYLTRFFQGLKINAAHDGSTRKWWTLEILKQLQPSDLEKVVLRLVDLREYKADKKALKLAVQSMNDILAIDNLKVGFNGAQPILLRADPISFDESEFAKPVAEDEADFLGKQFSDDIKVTDLGLDAIITPYLQERIDEIQAIPKHKAPLGTIFLLGSTLEGILLATAVKDPKKFMSAHAAPKDKKTGKVIKIPDWKLQALIDVACEVKLLGQDVKKFSHVLREFRNYIHPYHQMSQGFQPDQHTVDICWQVFKAAFEQLKKNS